MATVKVSSFRCVVTDNCCQPEAFDPRHFLRGATQVRQTMLRAAVLVLVGALSPLARAQDDAPKAQAPAPAPGAAADARKSQEPSPPEVQQKDSPPAEKRKAAPTAPAEEQKGAPAEPADQKKGASSAPGDAEKKSAPMPSPADREELFERAQAVSTAYRFAERYGIADDPARPDIITQYRVGMKHTTKFVREKPQAAPEKSEWSRTCRYTERAAKVKPTGEPTDLIRRYDRVILSKDLAPDRPAKPPFLEGMTIWYQKRPKATPLVLLLTEGRTLREDEYSTIVDEIGIPQLDAFLPTAPIRVSETWEIPPAAVERVSREMPDSSEYEMTGTLKSVAKSADGKSLVATIDVTGRFKLISGPTAFNARLEFEFEPGGIAISGVPAGREAKAIQAYGRIKHALLSHAMATTPADPSSRLRVLITHELILERRPLELLPGERGSPVAPLVLPVPMPEETHENSWVTFEHAERRFHFQHPQELRLQGQGGGADELEIRFIDERPAGRAAFSVVARLKAAASSGEEIVHDPASFKKKLERNWADGEVVVSKGQEGWLADDDWKELKRRVYRIEAGLKIPGRDKPVFADHYFVEFSPTQNILVFSWTERPDHVAYRTQAEEIIKSFQFGSADRPPSQQPPSEAPTTGQGTKPAQPDAPGEAPAAAPAAPAIAPSAPPQ